MLVRRNARHSPRASVTSPFGGGLGLTTQAGVDQSGRSIETGYLQRSQRTWGAPAAPGSRNAGRRRVNLPEGERGGSYKVTRTFRSLGRRRGLGPGLTC
jgi:hypothetical protein